MGWSVHLVPCPGQYYVCVCTYVRASKAFFMPLVCLELWSHPWSTCSLTFLSVPRVATVVCQCWPGFGEKHWFLDLVLAHVLPGDVLAAPVPGSALCGWIGVILLSLSLSLSLFLVLCSLSCPSTQPLAAGTGVSFFLLLIADDGDAIHFYLLTSY